MEILMELPTWILVILWWLSGFIPSLWTADAARRSTGRGFPSIARDQLYWSDLLLPLFISILGPAGGLISLFTAMCFELQERQWFDFMDRPIFPKKDK